MGAHYYDGPFDVSGTTPNHVDGWEGSETFPFPFKSQSTYAWTLGVNTPGFHRKRRKGELLPYTRFSKMEYSGTSSGSFTGSYDVYRTPSDGGAHINHWTSTLDLYTAFDCAYSQSWWESSAARIPRMGASLLQQVAGKIGNKGFDALTFAAEAGKLQSQFTGLVSRLRKLLTSKRVVVNAAGAWLEGRYAWRTLWFDMQDFQAALEQLNEGYRARISDRVGYSDSAIGEVLSPVGVYLGAFHARSRITWEVNVGYRASVTADIKAKLPAFRASLFQTTWELIPWSFVIDWFISVGSFLETLTFLSVTNGYSAATGMLVSYHEVEELDQVEKFPDTVTHKSTILASSRTERTLILTERSPATLPSIPQPHIRLNSYKVLDLIALAIQQMVRR